MTFGHWGVAATRNVDFRKRRASTTGWEIFQINQAVRRRHQQGRQGQGVPKAQTVSGMKRFAGIQPFSWNTLAQALPKLPADALATPRQQMICE
ncbi:MAG: hypothetical protein ACREUY_03660 [Burkholderiales bacterium]